MMHAADDAQTREGSGRFAGLRIRMVMVKITLVLIFAVVAVRLFSIQVLEHEKYRGIARRQYEKVVDLPAMRGAMYDRNGRILVSNTMFAGLGVEPWRVRPRLDDVAARFAETFGKSVETYRERIASSARQFVYLERRVSPDRVRRIMVDTLPGIVALPEPHRLYHYGSVAGQLIGFTGIDNNGLSGVELEFDSLLRGTPGRVMLYKDGLRRERATVDLPRIEPTAGQSLVLTVDLEYQAIAEEELGRGVAALGATSGLVIMIEPSTGEILAMAHAPSMNPSLPAPPGPDLQRNRCVTDAVEPGSVFKIVTAAAALHHGLVQPGKALDAEMGTYTISYGRGNSRTFKDPHPRRTLTFQEGFEVSSNIVMVKIAGLVGGDRFYTMSRDFGFGTRTGVELPGEIPGELKKPTRWSGASLHSMSFGYEVAVTPIQLCLAYAAIANGGVLMKPIIVRRILNEQQETIWESTPQSIRRVMSQSAASTLTGFLEGVVDRGTGSNARLEGVRVAGKTGTSRMIVDGKYQSGTHVATFAGFFPADDPKVVCVVMLHGVSADAGNSSAPIFRGIAGKLVRSSARFLPEPIPIAGRKPVGVPDVTSLRTRAAVEMLEEEGFDVEQVGSGAVVLAQSPLPGTRTGRGSAVRLMTEPDSTVVRDGWTTVPNLHGLSMRRAMNRVKALGLEPRVTGSGTVVEQLPKAGWKAQGGSVVSIRCAMPPIAGTTLY